MHKHSIRRLSAEVLTAILLTATLATPGVAQAATTAGEPPVAQVSQPTSSQPTAAPNQVATNSNPSPAESTTETQPTGLSTHAAKQPTSTATSSATSVPTTPLTNPAAIKAVVQGKDATEIAALIKSGQLDPNSLIQTVYQQINRENPALNDVIYTDPTNAAEQIATLQQNQAQTAPFYGVPLLLKGLGQAYKGYPATNGLTFEAANKYGYTKNFVQQLQKMGFVILGETNFPELGLINVTSSLLNGAAGNPWDATRNPGGSSGGSAAAVAAGWVPVATGNDAGGSLRIPASWSGVIGLKPTQGLILGDSTSPSVVNFVETRSIQDTAALLAGLTNPAKQTLLQAVPTNLKALKVAYSLTSPVGTPVSLESQAAVLHAVAFLRHQGFTVEEKTAPVDGVKLMQTYFLGALSNGSIANYLAKQFLHRNLTAADVDNGVISPMTYALYQASRKAPQTIRATWQNELSLVQQQMTAFHQAYPLYLTPTTATVAPKNTDPAFLPADVAKLKTIDTLAFPDQMQLIYDAWLHGLAKTPFTQLANLTGEPAISLPTYVSASNLPLGIQFQGTRGSDQTLLAVGKLFETAGQFQLRDQWLAKQAQVPTIDQPGTAEPTTTEPTTPDQGATTTQPTNPEEPTTAEPTDPDQGTTTIQPTTPGDPTTAEPTDPDQGATTTQPTTPGDPTTTEPTVPNQGVATTQPITPGDPTITEPITPNQSDTPTQQAVLTSNQLTCPDTDAAAAFQNDRPLPQPVNRSAQTALKVSHQLPQTGNQAGWFIELSGWLVVLSLLSLTLWVRRPQA